MVLLPYTKSGVTGRSLIDKLPCRTHPRQSCRFSIFVVCLLFCCIQLLGEVPPPNDDYENRIQLTGTSNIFSGTTVGATAQINELNPNQWPYDCGCDPTCTVWWTWTAPVTAQVSIDLIDYSDPRIRIPNYGNRPFIAIWTNVDWPNRTGQHDYGALLDLPGRRSVTFPATAGTAYDIQFSSAPYGIFTLRLIQTNAPVILDPPHNRLVSAGGSTFFGVIASGLGPFSYQWRFDGADLTNETFPVLSLDNIDATMAGSYSVVVSGISAVESPAAMLIVRTNEVVSVLSTPSINADGTVSFRFAGQALTSYRVESSSNLVDWTREQSLALPPPYSGVSSVLFNTSTTNCFTLAATSYPKFVRVLRYVPNFDTNYIGASSSVASEICINNLRKIRFAKELWAKERQDGWALMDGEDIDVPTDFVIIEFLGALPSCPLEPQPYRDPQSNFDVSYGAESLNAYPFCQIDRYNHVLEEPTDNY